MKMLLFESYIGRNNIGDEGAKAIAGALEELFSTRAIYEGQKYS